MDHQTSIRGICHLNWKMIVQNLVLFSIILIVSSACKASQLPTAPSRNFDTADLLILPSLLPPGWEIVEGPNPEQPHLLGMRKNLGGSHVRLEDFNSNLDHIVAVFPSSKDASHAYNDHDFTRDTQGEFATTWETPSGFIYDSSIANQFRVVCENVKNKDKIGDIGEICAIEAQYEEFVSVLIFRTNDAAIVTSNLEILAEAVDAQIGKYIGD